MGARDKKENKQDRALISTGAEEIGNKYVDKKLKLNLDRQINIINDMLVKFNEENQRGQCGSEMRGS